MSMTLYRKYRPQSWADIAGQNHVKVTLAFEVAANKTAHAYLFSGPRGIGKTTTARIFAKAVNCLENAGDKKDPENPGEPCGKCASCKVIGDGRSLDVIEIDAASHRGIDSVRENIIENARFSPSKLPYKVFIIDEVHMLTTEAFNALLKTLEEPPGHVMFVLATTELHKVPATIISRCQRFDFKKIPFQDLVERLHLIAEREGCKLESKTLEEITRNADGSLRDAEGLLGKVLTVGDGKRVTHEQAMVVLPRSDFGLVSSFVEAILRRDARSALMTVSECLEGGVDLDQFAGDIIELTRKVLITKMSGNPDTAAFGFDEEHKQMLTDFAALVEQEELVRALEVLMEKRREIRMSHPVQLPLELAAVKLCSTGGIRETTDAAPEKKETPRVTLKVGQRTEKAKAAPSPAPEAKGSGTSEAVVTVDRLDSIWPDFMRTAGEENHSLPFLLGVGKPIAVAGRLVRVGFGFAFHRRKFNEEKNRRILEKVLGQMLDADVQLEGVVLEKSEAVQYPEAAPSEPEGNKAEENKTEEKSGSFSQQMASAFEGRVVE